MAESVKRSVVLRLMGGVAIREHCSQYYLLADSCNRAHQDLDLAGYLNQVADIQRLFLDLGFTENNNVMRLSGTERRIFYAPDAKIHVDVVLDKLFFCHTIDLRERLLVDFPTIPLADLLLSKLQIKQQTEKDMMDAMVLLLAHNIGYNDRETINTKYIATLTAGDWGLWKTVTDNLITIRDNINVYFTDTERKENINSKILLALREIEAERKSLLWKLRNSIGNRIKWYNDVEELEN